MANLTESQKQEIRTAAENTCLAKGYVRYIDDPMTGTPMINPVFAACSTKEYNDALAAADQGNLQQWLNNSRNFVKSKGGVLGILQGVAGIAQKINEIKTGQQMATNNPTGTGQSNLPPDTKKSTVNPMIWVALVIIIILVIVLLVVLMKKPKEA